MSADNYHRVRTVNPGKGRPKRKRKTVTTRRKRKTTTTRRRRRRRRSNPSSTTTRRRTTRRRSPSRRRRRNPSGGGLRARWSSGGINLSEPFRNWRPLWVLLGKAAGAFAVRKWGDPELSSGSTFTMGGRWSIKNHLLNLVGGYVMGRIAGMVKGREAAQGCWNGAVDLSVSKAFWHEIIQAIPGGTTYFGNLPPELSQLLSRAQAGDTIDDGRGNRYVVQVTQGGQKQMVPMMGLQQQRPLDGLEKATPLDGLTTATPLDGWQQRKLQAREANMRFGHLTVGDSISTNHATYLRRGSTDPYAAAYMGGR